jgi:diamine N-acetyltransferase
MKLRRATADDIDTIMAIERMPGYDALVGQWTVDEHAAHLKDAAFTYLVLADENGPSGFVALHSRQGDVRITRMIAGATGQGLGKVLMRAVLAMPMIAAASRVWLCVAAHNGRAIRLYQSFGFTETDRQLAAGTLPNGQLTDLIVMTRSTELP